MEQQRIQSIRGMSDVLPQDAVYWQYVEQTLRAVVTTYGYHELRFPILEATNLFARTIGEITDIVEKEMYTFVDRNGESVTLRPEGTASCVRAGIQHGFLYNQTQRLWYLGPMFRHERPQKGRFRQFHQFGVEAFGMVGPDIDAEVLLIAARFWQALGISNKVTLQLNTLGSEETRVSYRRKLVDYFTMHEATLDADSKRRLTLNPLRILDSKNPAMREIINHAPKILGCLDMESQRRFDKLCHLLDIAAIDYEINPCLVRGLDYYCDTVFEWVTTELGTQNAICAGGHYDKLVAQLGGKATPAIGFALGLERLIELVRANAVNPSNSADIYLVTLGDAAFDYGLVLAEKLRTAIPQLILILNCGGGSLGAQLKRADKSEAQLALIIGDEERQGEQVTLKWLRHVGRQQETISDALLVEFLQQQFAENTR